MIRFEDLVEKVRGINPDADIDLLRRAYVFSAFEHKGQVRHSGEPYLVHPLEVADLLADMKLDVVAIAAGLLHDIVEDTQTPIERIKSVSDLLDTPVSKPDPATAGGPAAQPAAPVMRLGDIASIYPRSSLESVNHYTVQRELDIAANVDDRDLGAVAADIQDAIKEVSKGLPITTKIQILGQSDVMQSSFRSLGIGMILGVLLVYALLVILFQSWVDPFIIMMAVPGALIGILWMLAVTGTTINVESLMGAIMSIGISVSNSILVVSFANDLRAREEVGPLRAVIDAGRIRLRPVLMTALAMIIGMVPMALGLGEAGEQNAPLGRAVIGGLIVATISTLFVVPIFYTLLRRKPPSLHSLDTRFAAEAAGAHTTGDSHG